MSAGPLHSWQWQECSCSFQTASPSGEHCTPGRPCYSCAAVQSQGEVQSCFTTCMPYLTGPSPESMPGLYPRRLASTHKSASDHSSCLTHLSRPPNLQCPHSSLHGHLGCCSPQAARDTSSAMSSSMQVVHLYQELRRAHGDSLLCRDFTDANAAHTGSLSGFKPYRPVPPAEEQARVRALMQDPEELQVRSFTIQPGFESDSRGCLESDWSSGLCHPGHTGLAGVQYLCFRQRGSCSTALVSMSCALELHDTAGYLQPPGSPASSLPLRGAAKHCSRPSLC